MKKSCNCTCHPTSLADSESEKFFRHLNNGEVYLVKHYSPPPFDSLISDLGYRITITPKGDNA